MFILIDILIFCFFASLSFILSYSAIWVGLNIFNSLNRGKGKWLPSLLNLLFFWIVCLFSIFWAGSALIGSKVPEVILTKFGFVIGSFVGLFFVYYFTLKFFLISNRTLAFKISIVVFLFNVFTQISLCFLIKTAFFSIDITHGRSMKPTINNHDVILERKYPYFFNLKQPKIGDILLISKIPGDFEDLNLGKRCVAVQGNVIQIKNGIVYLNGNKQNEPYADTSVNIDSKKDHSEYGPVTIENKNIFVLGDNRNNSTDSRKFGPIPISSVGGENILKIWDSAKNKFTFTSLVRVNVD